MDEPADRLALGAEEADRLRAELAMDAAGIGTFNWDLVTGRLDWDDRLIELFGYNPATFSRTIEGFNARLHPDDLPRVTQALQSAIDTCGDFQAVYRVCLPDGATR
ncbi:PAS domain-containing protein [Klenkia sp. PcliD-1-E]|uniref:PAS domain-containing protein n=1 Tax=Klenkia sp. PcliD-1-E TaxID=2954492 RepID=UPI0020974F81|nr:PAS domain-containing protein [Klenkia sp. PcliD-1-E]MCO7218335.1 PAS domain-containing protein [Klenkia sp. PcliD-1-E]